MDQATHNKIVSFIWGIADDVLRDLLRRGKYPDVILPMCVLRRLDAVLEPTKKAVLQTRTMLDHAGITEQTAALCSSAGQAFYNTSKFTLRDLKSRGSQQQLLADFEDYLNGFSPNVQDILENFKFRNQLSTLSKADALGTLISKFLDPEIDLTPAGIDNHSMGTVFEELVRKFNEENNEEADDDLFRKFSKIADALEKRLDEWGADAEESDDEEGAKKKGLPEKIKRKLLDSKTQERDGRLVDTATRLREEIGGKLFEDHNVFREKVFAGLWKLVIKLPAALFPEFSGVSNGHSTVCNARIQAVYDRISGKIIDFSIDPYSKNDLAAAPEREIMEGDLVLRDRGYLSNCRRDPETP